MKALHGHRILHNFQKEKNNTMRQCLLKRLVAFLLLMGSLVLAEVAQHQSLSVFTRLENGAVDDDGCLRIGEQYITRLEDDFTAPSGQWKIGTNLGDKLEIGLGERNGKKGLLVVSRNQSNASGETHHLVNFDDITVEPGGHFRLTLRAMSNLNLDLPYYCGWMTCWNQLTWQDAEGNDVGCIDLSFGPSVSSDSDGLNVIVGDVPANAAKASIVLGSYSTHFSDEAYILYTYVRFESTPSAPTLHPLCTAVSRPISIGPYAWWRRSPSLFWAAEVPDGSALAINLFHCKDKNGQPDGQWEGPLAVANGARLPWKNGWLRYEATLTASPNGATPVLKSIIIGKVMDAKWSGADTLPPIVRQLSSVRVKDAQTPVEFEVTDDSAILWNTLRVTIDGRDITAEVRREANGRLVYTPSEGLAPLEPAAVKHGDSNFHILNISVQDEAGNTASQPCYVHVTERFAPNHVTLRKDGAVLVNGEPFFPIFLFGVGKVDFNGNNFENALRELKEIGFNAAHTYTTNPYMPEDPEDGKDYPKMQEFLTAAEHQNLKVFVNGGLVAGSKGNLSNVLRQFSSPAIMGWYIGDDTATFTNAGDLRQWHETLRHADPDHITLQADWISPNAEGYSNYFPFVHASNGILPEIYCIQNREEPEACASRVIKTMEDVKRDIQRSGSPVKTIWPILQNFMGDRYFRFPNFDELRVMSYEAIIHGANGISWFVYGGGSGDFKGATDTPESWENMRRLVAELSALQDVFLEEERLPVEATVTDGPQKDSLGYPSISVLAKRHNDRLFLICANSANKEVAVQLPCPNMSRARVWFEDREIPLKNGILQDTFAPRSVHVYEICK